MSCSPTSFETKFELIQAGWSSSQVRQLLGDPTEGEDTTVPDGSGWGTQPAMAYKIQAGELVRQWMFHAEDWYHYVWFARIGGGREDPWRVALRLKVGVRL